MSEPTLFGRFPLKFAPIVASTGTTELVAAVAGLRIRVITYTVVTDTGIGISFKSGSTLISGVMTLAANNGISAEHDVGLLETAPGEAFNLTQTAAATVGGHLAYILI